MSKCRVLISHPCRSDEALVDPLVNKLRKEWWCEVYQKYLTPGDYLKSYSQCQKHFDNNEHDLVIVIGDRIEQLALCQCAFLHNIPIAVYGSGITNSLATWDDISRHQIALMATICLCEDIPSCHRVMKLRYALDMAKESKIFEKTYFYDYDIHYVGNLYLDTLWDNIDESLVPTEPYNLILLNPETINPSEIYLPDTDILTILIEKNADHWLKEWVVNYGKYYENLERPLFLGLLKNCSKFYTNSSSMYYEAMPLGLKREQIIQVGKRNLNRSTPMDWSGQDYKSSDKIVNILRTWWEAKQ